MADDEHDDAEVERPSIRDLLARAYEKLGIIRPLPPPDKEP